MRRPLPARPVLTADTLGKADWNGAFPFDWGVSAHPKVDDAHRRAAVLQLQQGGAVHALRRRRRQQRAGALHRRPAARPAAAARHGVHRELRDPQRLPAVLGSRAAGRPTSTCRGFHRDMPSRFAVIPRRGGPDDIRWFEADPTYVLHCTNAYEDGDEIVLDGFFQGDPHPVDSADGRQVASRHSASSPSTGCRPGCTAGGSTSSPAQTSEEQLSDTHHRVRHDQRRLRRRATTATPTPRPASPAGSCSTGWSSTTWRPAPRSASRSATACTAARPRWRRASAAPARTTATW